MANQKKQRPTYSKRKFIVTFCVTMALFAAIRHGFSLRVPNIDTLAEKLATLPDTVSTDETLNKELLAETSQEEVTESEDDSDITNDEDLVDEDTLKGEIPAEEEVAEENTDAEESLLAPIPNAKKHRVMGVHSWTECFPDSQSLQIVAAEKNGIRPCATREDALALVARHKLVNITNSPFYVVDDLHHSMPYLVPKAQHLINTISLNFIDSLQAKGIPPHLPMITSVLRTTDDVSRLQRGNGNATTNSCHCYGTTVDITYNRFVPLVGYYDPHTELTRWSLPMKQVLAEVLRDLREEGKCYVKYEYKQACFHLTVR